MIGNSTLRTRRGSPGHLIMLLGVGHAVWGLVAYHEPLRELVSAGVVDSVGDGIFRKAESRGARVTAFWFLFAAPLVSLCGYLAERALRAGDRRAAELTGWTVLGLGALCTTIVPRSGFPFALPAGYWLVRRAQSQQPEPRWRVRARKNR